MKKIRDFDTHLSVNLMAFGENEIVVRQTDEECVNVIVGRWPKAMTITLTNEDAELLRAELTCWACKREREQPYPPCPTAPAADETVEMTEEAPK